MLVSRSTVRQLRTGEPSDDPLDALGADERSEILRSLVFDGDGDKDALPLSGGLGRLPGEEERKVNGKAPPLSSQARTGRPSLLGDR